MVLRELFVKIGFQVDDAKLKQADHAMKRFTERVVDYGLSLSKQLAASLEDAFIGFNARAEQAKMGLAGIAGMNLKLPWEEAKKAADELYAGLQEDAAKTPAETAELVDFSQQIAGAYLAAGKNMKDLRQFTTQAVVAAKMLKAEGTAATDIKQAIQGRVGVKDMFAANVINSLGMSIEAFNKKTMQERADLFAKGLNNPTIRAAMEEYETQWDGITSTIKDNFSIILGEAGKPLFNFLKRTLGEFGKWIMKNKEPITKFFKTLVEDVTAIGGVLLSVGNIVRGVLVTAFTELGSTGKIAFAVLGAAILAAMSPLAALAAIVSGFMLVVDDIRGYYAGEDSLYGRFIESIEKWLAIKPEDSQFMMGLKSLLAIIKEIIDSLQEAERAWNDLLGDGSKSRAFIDKRAGKNQAQLTAASDAQTLETARRRAAMGLPLTDAAKLALERSGVTPDAFMAKYSPTARAPEARTSMSSASSAISVSAPMNISITTQPGQSNEAIAQEVTNQIQSFWDGQMSSAVAGAGH
jgi:hypothetical protein